MWLFDLIGLQVAGPTTFANDVQNNVLSLRHNSKRHDWKRLEYKCREVVEEVK
jgi:hypothetical protein